MEQWLLDLVEHLGYVGIFVATLIESTFVPIPAEVTMIPAGMLAAKGEMNYWLALISSVLGVIAGSCINYWIGIRFGRTFLLRYGRYIFIKPSFLHKTELFFARYGRMAVFLGRLLPGIKHYIAFVAGIAQMKFQPFITYTAFGGLIWMWVILQIGYMAEKQAEHSANSLSSLELIVIAITGVTIVAWFIKTRLMRH